ncbi:hypothetical protein Cst_c21110 [Thermoclostridium stercorarium subsp. stercorarium DSM 8532]|uniref:Uncharacterized protein n=1 Tax=Thermoclostridium stercorarium (strain ATCC 35414 / DSM 8532 / NCIMB 11754) TaxID=1121335 RepID=L7VU22_THES1|nr:hypothetical protein Cst_c21110 [Thermoclostridium stercorarium subsp. stercorarium DSM 8532]
MGFTNIYFYIISIYYIPFYSDKTIPKFSIYDRKLKKLTNLLKKA